MQVAYLASITGGLCRRSYSFYCFQYHSSVSYNEISFSDFYRHHSACRISVIQAVLPFQHAVPAALTLNNTDY